MEGLELQNKAYLQISHSINTQPHRREVGLVRLLKVGYNHIVLDSGWFGTDSLYYPENGQTVDEWGRLLPNKTYYPDGFGPLASLCKSLGLKWGFWIMGGIPRLAVQRKSKVLGTNYTADEIADLSNATLCSWNKWLVYGSKRLPSGELHPGAKAYYDSIAKLYAEWGVDFIKMDCVFGANYWRGKLEMEQFARSMKRASTKYVTISLSPGQSNNVSGMAPIGRAFAGPGGAAEGTTVMARVTGDFWDRWSELYSHFRDAAPKAAPFVNKRFFPDLDMLPLGWVAHTNVNGGPPIGRWSEFNLAEARSLMSQWVMARAPLFWGGAASESRCNATTLSIIANPEVINVGRTSCGNRQVRFDPATNLSYWAAEAVLKDGSRTIGPRKYIAIFNIGEEARNARLDLRETTLPGPPFASNGKLLVRDVWSHEPATVASVDAKGELTTNLAPHASVLLLVAQEERTSELSRAVARS